MPATLVPPTAKGNLAGVRRGGQGRAVADPLDLLWIDPWYLAIDKPPGTLVHPTRLAAGEAALLQRVRDRLGAWIYPVHRLDRPTSGVLIFGRSPEAASRLAACFRRREVTKDYLAVVRGYTPSEGRIDYPVEDTRGRLREAVTQYRRLAQVEVPYPVGRYPTSRYSLVQVMPETGRWHQIRRHFHHISHPLIGDTTHGEGRHNRFFRTHYGVRELLLSARRLGFNHPFTGSRCEVVAPLGEAWQRLFDAFDWQGVSLPGAGD